MSRIKFVVLIKFWQVIVPATMNTDKCNFVGLFFAIVHCVE